jgi:hypothetical protein
MTANGKVPASLRPLALLGLFAVLGIGSLALWTVVPLGWVSLGAELGDGDPFRTYAVAIVGAPPTMLALGIGLRQVEAMYMRVLGRPSRSVLEPMLVLWAIVAVVALVVWWAVGDPIEPSGPLTY